MCPKNGGGRGGGVPLKVVIGVIYRGIRGPPIWGKYHTTWLIWWFPDFGGLCWVLATRVEVFQQQKWVWGLGFMI